jgi:hypothetical protein
MKNTFSLIATALLLTACHGPGRPAERTGRTMDHGAATVGHGIKKAGDKIEDVAQ